MNIQFPDIPPQPIPKRRCIWFPARVDGAHVCCLVEYECLIGKDSQSGLRAVAMYQAQKSIIHATAQALIKAGEVHGNELLISAIDADNTCLISVSGRA